MTENQLQTVAPTTNAYFVQAHEISRAAYIMPIISRRLLHLIMAQAQYHNTGRFDNLEMDECDVLKVLELTPDRAREIRFAVKGLMSQVLEVKTDEGWIQFHWVERASYNKTTKTYQFKVSDDLIPYVLTIKEMFTLLPVTLMAKLQGKYALRLFEIVMANRGHAGKGGNAPGQWFTDLDFEHVRYLFKIEPDEYTLTANLRRKVIDAPIKEINDAHIGVRITANYEKFRHGKKLLGVRLICEYLKNNERVETPATPTEKEDDEWIRQNEELYAKIRKDVTLLPGMPIDSEFFKNIQALKELKEHPDAIKPKKHRS